MIYNRHVLLSRRQQSFRRSAREDVGLQTSRFHRRQSRQAGPQASGRRGDGDLKRCAL